VSRWRAWLNKQQPNLLDHLLWWLLRSISLAYTSVMWIRNRMYDWRWKSTYKSSLPVISIGNLSVGGTGKSPAVAWFARWLRSRELRVAILSRGYGQLEDGRNDEALELELKLPDVPHLQNSDRVAAAILAADELEMEVLLLDDGFQHRRLQRDLDVVLIDATDSNASQWLLPAGLRREPMSSLRRADFVIITRSDQVASSKIEQLKGQIQRFVPASQCVSAVHQPHSLLQAPKQVRSLTDLRGRKVLAFCGIGNPASFFESLKQLGANLVATRTWPDHHAYCRADVDWLTSWHADEANVWMVCTVKDWVKIQEARLGDRELLALVIELELVGDSVAQLESALDKLLLSNAN
jgi:tetraacyldisaccharide 4'-kinase